MKMSAKVTSPTSFTPAAVSGMAGNWSSLTRCPTTPPRLPRCPWTRCCPRWNSAAALLGRPLRRQPVRRDLPEDFFRAVNVARLDQIRRDAPLVSLLHVRRLERAGEHCHREIFQAGPAADPFEHLMAVAAAG